MLLENPASLTLPGVKIDQWSYNRSKQGQQDQHFPLPVKENVPDGNNP